MTAWRPAASLTAFLHRRCDASASRAQEFSVCVCKAYADFEFQKKGGFCMKKITCPPPCGAEFKVHTMDELTDIVNVHVKHQHPKDFPKGLPREEVMKMAKEA